MGCDIHMWAEINRKNKDNTYRWEMVGNIFKNPYYQKDDPSTKFVYEDGDVSENNYPLCDRPWDLRNYDLFAILADVRNGHGFAGVDTGDGFIPIAPPRGVPEDASLAYKKEVEKWQGDGHSHSYFSVRELASYDWHGLRTKHRGYVNPKEYEWFQRKGKPTKGFCAGVDGANVVKISNEQMEQLNNPVLRILNVDKTKPIMEFDKNKSYYTLVEWEESYYDSCVNFVDKTIPALQALFKKTNVQDVRIVFFFDN